MHSGDVSVRDAPAFRVHPVQVRQLRQKERRLELVEPAVVALVYMVVLVIRAIIAQSPHPFRQRVVIRHHRAGVAQRTQIFAGIEAEPRRVAKGAHPAALIGCAVGLGAVLHHLQAVAAGNGHDRVHVAGLAIQVHRHDGPRMFRDRPFYPRRINVAGVYIRFDEHDLRAHIGDGQRRGNKGRRRHDHLVTRADVQRLQGQHQRVQSVAHADTVARAAIIGECLLKSLVLRAADVPRAPEHPVEGSPQVLLQITLHGQEG